MKKRLFVPHVVMEDGVEELLPEFIYDIHVRGVAYFCPACASVYARVTVYEITEDGPVPSEHYPEVSRCFEHGNGRLYTPSFAIGPTILRLWDREAYHKWGKQTLARELNIEWEHYNAQLGNH